MLLLALSSVRFLGDLHTRRHKEGVWRSYATSLVDVFCLHSPLNKRLTSPYLDFPSSRHSLKFLQTPESNWAELTVFIENKLSTERKGWMIFYFFFLMISIKSNEKAKSNQFILTQSSIFVCKKYWERIWTPLRHHNKHEHSSLFPGILRVMKLKGELSRSDAYHTKAFDSQGLSHSTVCWPWWKRCTEFNATWT